MTDSTTTLPVGRTALRAPRLALGTGPLGNLYQTISEKQAVETIQAAFNSGVKFFDTAPLYGAGQSERFLGTALRGIPRDQYVLSTKVGRLVRPDGTIKFDDYDFTREGVLRSFEASLARLIIDRIDILHMHDPDDHYQDVLDKAFPALAELRAQGVIRAIGAGMNQWQMPAEFARHADFDCFLLAGRYTLLEQGGQEFFSLCQSKGISVFLGGVYNSGILATGAQLGAKYNYIDAPPEILERVRRIEAACARHGVSLRSAALQFPRAQPAVHALIIGAQSAAEFKETLQALNTPIPSELWAELRAEGLLAEFVPVPGKG
jgi:D-threo-aldose 1-dehydrogenase